MNLSYNKCKEAAKFWNEISERLDHCMIYMRNDCHSDREYINIVCGLLTSVNELCKHRAEVLTEKYEALEKLAGGAE